MNLATSARATMEAAPETHHLSSSTRKSLAGKEKNQILWESTTHHAIRCISLVTHMLEVCWTILEAGQRCSRFLARLWQRIFPHFSYHPGQGKCRQWECSGGRRAPVHGIQDRCTSCAYLRAKEAISSCHWNYYARLQGFYRTPFLGLFWLEFSKLFADSKKVQW